MARGPGDRKAAVATAGLIIVLVVAIVLKFGPPSPAESGLFWTSALGPTRTMC